MKVSTFLQPLTLLARQVENLKVERNLIMTRLATLAILIALAASVVPAHSQEKVEESPYLPLKVGNAWTYQAFDGQRKIALVNKVVAHEKVGDVMCAKVETYLDGKAVANEHVAVTKDGIYRFTLNGQKLDRPAQLMKLPPKAGDEWKIDTKFGNETLTGSMKSTEEKLKVPAGTYDAFLVSGKLETNGRTIVAASYFVKDVGIAKIKMDYLGMSLAIELEKFEAAK